MSTPTKLPIAKPMSTRALAAIASALLVLSTLVAGIAPAGAGLVNETNIEASQPISSASAALQESTTTLAPTTTLKSGGSFTALPKPGSGQEPVEEGDRGSFSQYALMGGIILALGIIGLLIRRESKSKLAQKKTSAK